MRRITFFLLLLAVGFARPAWALDAAAVEKLALGESDEKIAAISSLVAEADPRAVVVLEALGAGELQVAGKRVLIVKSGDATDALTGASISPIPEGAEDVSANNRVRSAVQSALAALRLMVEDRDVRLAAVKELAGSADESVLPLVRKALAQESDAAVKSQLAQIAATLQVKSGTREERLTAVRTLAASDAGNTRTMLASLLESEKDVEVRSEIERSLKAIDARVAWHARAGLAFAGVSLGSLLLLAALASRSLTGSWASSTWRTASSS